MHTVLDLPAGVFTGSGVKTVILFFEKGSPTRKIWYYQLNLDRNLGKTNPLSEDDLADFVKLQETKADSDNSWTIKTADVNEETWDLSIKNPNKEDEKIIREPEDILKEIAMLDKQAVKMIAEIEKNLMIKK